MPFIDAIAPHLQMFMELPTNPDMRRSIQVAAMVLRGLGVLLSPRPCLHGGSLSDVEYVLGKKMQLTTDAGESTFQVTADLEDCGRILARHLTSDQIWQDRVESYRIHVGSDVVYYKDVNQLHEQLKAVRKSLPKVTKDVVAATHIAPLEEALGSFRKHVEDLYSVTNYFAECYGIHSLRVCTGRSRLLVVAGFA